ncbi:hypothetical protein [Amycolatopsis alkalitolerans]|uniref:Uncharacterized protein n=1 Tax=Amycolatopsis alkalitolerans TaxID=2547244 RepID=A0A5C4LYT3_9PSEU|nr:hypothetical protein [Amycolatopsis alkalitolerans]TNC24338.1 hypothetical protein FG385_18105 [Amycolatopsis alkalitolerans]
MGNSVVISGLEWVRGEEESLEGHSADLSSQDWVRTALDDRAKFAKDLRLLGLDHGVVRQGLRLRDEAEKDLKEFSSPTRFSHIDYADSVGGHVSGGAAAVTFGQRLRDWWDARKILVEARQDVAVRIPLFVLSAPKIETCAASVKIAEQRARKVEWEVKILGSGIGGGRAVMATVTSSFSASNGENKLIFLPVTVGIERVRITEGGREIGRGYRVDPSTRGLHYSAPGSLLLDSDYSPHIGALKETYSLAGDSPGAISEYEYTYEQEDIKKYSVGFKIKEFEASLQFSHLMHSSATLGFKLCGGHDYALHGIDDCEGVAWPA